MIHLRYSFSERFIPLTKPLVQGAWYVRCLCLILYRWHNVIIFLMNSVPLSVTRFSGNPIFAMQCCICIIGITMGYWVECYVVCKCVSYDNYIWVSFWRGWYWFFCIEWVSVVKIQTFPLRTCFSAICFWCGYDLFNRHVMQLLHNTLIQIGAFGK